MRMSFRLFPLLEYANICTILLLISVVPCVSQSPPPVAFAATRVTYPVGSSPYALAVADFNRDGKPDLVLTNGCQGSIPCGSATVTVLFGNGDGTFHTGPNVGTGLEPSSVAVGDFDGDGNQDIVTANYAVPSSISVLLGNGDGTFQTASNYSVGPGPTAVTVGDFNGDGKSDIIVDHLAGQSLTVLLGKGNGTFQTATTFAVGLGSGSPGFVALSDFNGDGNLDVALTTCASSGSCGVRVLVGNGDGTFQAAGPYVSWLYPSGIAAGDLNGDGKPDLVELGCGTSGSSCGLTVWLGNGDGTFQEGVNYTALPGSLGLADFNRDGKLDLATVGCPSGCCNLSVLLGNGDGTFQAALNSAITGPAGSVAVGDFDADGKLDFVTIGIPSTGVASVRVLLGNGDGTFDSALVNDQFAATLGNSQIIGDFNGDNRDDLVLLACVSYQCSSMTMTVLSGKGDATFQAGTTSSLVGAHGALAVGDFNGDGKLDLVLGGGCNSVPCNVTMLLGNGDGTFRTGIMSRGGNPSSAAVGDFNGDGKLDLVLGNIIGSNVSVLLGNGNGGFKTPANYDIGLLNYQNVFVAAGDFNHDGKLDLAVTGYISSNSASGLKVLLGNGDGTFQPPLDYPGYGGAMAVGDFNGDGKPDLAVTGCMVGANCGVSILLGNGDGSFQTPTYYATGPRPSSITVGDFNGDGVLDLAVVNSSGASVSILSNRGDGTFQMAGNYGAESSFWSIIAAEDFDSDGRTDLVITANNIVTLLRNTTPNFLQLTTHTSIVSSPDPSSFGQVVNFTGTVSSIPGRVPPTGTLTLMDGGVPLGTASLSAGSATFSVSSFLTAWHMVTAAYSGDSNWDGSTSTTLTQKVNKAATKTLVSSSRNPSLLGQPVTFTAVVGGSYGGTPTGVVTFVRQGVGSIGTVTLNNGIAIVTTSFSAAGKYSIFAVYQGNTNFLKSTSPSLAQQVSKFPTTTTMVSSLNPSAYGQLVTLTATVASTYGMPTGNVTFKRATTVVGTTALNGSTATFSTAALNAGTNYVTAVYNGDTSFAASTSPQLGEVVKKISSTTTLSSSANPSTVGQSITLTATVSASVGTPTGNVTFKKGMTALGTAALNGGVATFSTSALPAGSNSITAKYGGGTNYQPSTSDTLTQVVQ